MLEVIHSLNMKKVLKYEMKTRTDCFFIISNNGLEKDREALINKGMKEIKIGEMNNEERICCEKEYINNIAELGSIYNSAAWWANAVSEKNEYLPCHYKNLCSFYILIKTLNKYINKDMQIFIVCNCEIFTQLKIYCNQNDIRIISVEKPVVLWMKVIFDKFNAMFHTAYVLIKLAIRKMYVSYTVAPMIKKELDNTKNYYAIRTWVDRRFLTGECPAHDVHFGRLPEYARQHGHKLLLLVGITNNFTKVIKKIRENEKYLIIPEEYFLKYLDFVHLFTYLRFKRVKLKKKILFNGLEVTTLYERAINRGYFSAYYLFNIVHYVIAKRLAQAVGFKTFIQTFENYAWEKMSLLGMKEYRPNVKVIGFQHAYVSRNSFKYFPGELEKDIIPLPDRIVTMGKRTKEIMERYGSYNNDIIEIGCALRQEYLNDVKPLKRRRLNRIIVPLTMVKKESILIMNFLCCSGLQQNGLEVVIRCHPAAPFETFRKYIKFNVPESFIINDEKSVQEELSEVDFVVYTWTTIAIEAFKMGIPVIHLDILSPMYVDPLFECNVFKKNVKAPDELLLVIEDFYSMGDKNFYKEQQIAQEYLKEYFYPVNEENLAAFFT